VFFFVVRSNEAEVVMAIQVVTREKGKRRG